MAEGGGKDAYPWLDRILVVDTPEQVQLARLLRRDGIDEALARTMIAAQATRQQRLAMAENQGQIGRGRMGGGVFHKGSQAHAAGQHQGRRVQDFP